MNNLLFFNTQGYPYNFLYDLTGGTYSGKLLFDHNSSDLFKSIGLYIFEEVPSITLQSNFNLDSLELFDHSGITITKGNNITYLINDIETVNKGPYYSKWIYGNNFNSLFPLGSIIYFTGITSANFTNPTYISDFYQPYYFVMDNKPGAILITTPTINSTYNMIFITGTTAYIASDNYIIYNDYVNQITQPSNFSKLYLYPGQTLSYLDNNYPNNNGVYHLKNYGLSSTYYQEYTIPTGQTGQIRLQLELLTEKPKIYSGEVIIGITGSTASVEFVGGLNSQFNDNTGEVEIGKTIIFEDYDGNSLFNNQFFEINQIVDKTYLSNCPVELLKIYNQLQSQYLYFNSTRSKIFPVVFNDPNNPPDNIPKQYIVYDYFINISADTNLSINDIIILSSNTGLNVGKQLTISQVYNDQEYSSYQISTPINPETNTYTINQVLQSYQINTLICSVGPTGTYSYDGPAISYLTTNLIDFIQPIANYDPYYYNTIQNFMTQYKNTLNNLGVDAYTLGLIDPNLELGPDQPNNFVIEGLYNMDQFYQQNFKATVFLENYNSSIQLSAYTGMTVLNRYYLNLADNLVESRRWERYSTNVAKEYLNIIQFNLNNNQNNYGFNLRLNGTDFYTSFSGDTTTTLNTFVYQDRSIDTVDSVFSYQDAFYMKGFNLNCTGNTLTVSGLYPDINVWEFVITVSNYSTYSALTLVENQGTSLICSDLILKNESYFNYGFSTGMIITLSGSNVFNNNQYNIINLLENTYTISGITGLTSILSLSYQGHFEPSNLFSFDQSFDESFNVEMALDNLYLMSQTYLRKPRYSYTNNTYYKFSWQEPYDTSMFFYDFSGTQPVLVNGPTDTNGNYISSLAYQGIVPLYDIDNPQNLYLNPNPNMNLNSIMDPTTQETVFNTLQFELDLLNSENINYIPDPLQVFIGYNSPNEGYNSNVLIMQQIEYITFSGFTNSISNPNGVNFNISGDGSIRYVSPNYFNFVDMGFETGQLISLSFIDKNISNQTIYENYEDYLISWVTKTTIQIDISVTENPFQSFYTSGNTSGYTFSISVQPKTILTCNIYGDTEIEDERLGVNLINVGAEISTNVEPIFKETNIEEFGIDYVFLNAKRKEMLASYTEIFNYVGAYKAMINAINFFGYNDLQVYEYYRNIDTTSPLFLKLHKVLIPDIFDNSTEGFIQSNFIKDSERVNYRKTNLFNLTYEITDGDGNNVLTYSLEEVQIKLNGLKTWLTQNVIPLSSKIIDITGVANTENTTHLVWEPSYNVKKLEVNRKSNSINFVIKETQNFDQNTLLTIDFYTINPDFNPTNGWSCKLKTFSKDPNTGQLTCQQYFNFYKTDLDSITVTFNKNIDPYLWIETAYYNEIGLGFTNKILRNMLIARNYYLINHNLHTYLKGINYLYVGGTNGLYYFFDENGYMYVSETWLDQEYPGV